MPNGNPDFDVHAFESFISPAEKSIRSLVARRGLVLEMYYHDSASWSLRFAHPNGGLGKVEIYMQSQSNAKIHGIWWLDDYDKGTRSTRRSSACLMSPSTPEFIEHVESVLDEVLCWQKGDWDSVHGGHRDIWSKYPKEMYERVDNCCQIPKMKTD